jgi:ketosteroid isomerase-like protein
MQPYYQLSAIVLTVSFISLAPVSAQQAQQNREAAEREVRDTVTRLVAAYGANDLETYFSFFADDMTVWWGTSGRNDRPTPKAAYVKGWPEFVKKTGGHESCRVADLRIQPAPSADAAVASYELTCVFKKPPSADGREATYEITEAFFKRNGAWQVVHFNWRERTPPARQ